MDVPVHCIYSFCDIIIFYLFRFSSLAVRITKIPCTWTWCMLGTPLNCSVTHTLGCGVLKITYFIVIQEPQKQNTQVSIQVGYFWEITCSVTGLRLTRLLPLCLHSAFILVDLKIVLSGTGDIVQDQSPESIMVPKAPAGEDFQVQNVEQPLSFAWCNLKIDDRQIDK